MKIEVKAKAKTTNYLTNTTSLPVLPPTFPPSALPKPPPAKPSESESEIRRVSAKKRWARGTWGDKRVRRVDGVRVGGRLCR